MQPFGRSAYWALVNTLHPAAGQIKVEKPQVFRFDSRMFR